MAYRLHLAAYFILVSYLAYSSTLTMEAWNGVDNMINNKRRAVCGMTIDGENLSQLRQPDANATLSTINPTRLDRGSILGRQGGEPATNRLSWSTTCSVDSVSEIHGSLLIMSITKFRRNRWRRNEEHTRQYADFRSLMGKKKATEETRSWIPSRDSDMNAGLVRAESLRNESQILHVPSLNVTANYI